MRTGFLWWRAAGKFGRLGAPSTTSGGTPHAGCSAACSVACPGDCPGDAAPDADVAATATPSTAPTALPNAVPKSAPNATGANRTPNDRLIATVSLRRPADRRRSPPRRHPVERLIPIQPPGGGEHDRDPERVHDQPQGQAMAQFGDQHVRKGGKQDPETKNFERLLTRRHQGTGNPARQKTGVRRDYNGDQHDHCEKWNEPD